MMFSRAAILMAVLFSFYFSATAQNRDPTYDSRLHPSGYKHPIAGKFYIDIGSCSMKATIYNTAGQPARFDGSLTDFYHNLLRNVVGTFTGPAVLRVIIDSSGKVCFKKSVGLVSAETNEIIERAVSRMKWIPAVQDGHRVYFDLEIDLRPVGSMIVAAYADAEPTVRLLDNQNLKNAPTVTTSRKEIWKNWNFGNSMIPDNYAQAVARDRNGSIWIATIYGIVKMNKEQSNWNIYSSKTIPQLAVDSANQTGFVSIAVDHTNNVWVSSFEFVARFDGITWTRYDASNSPLWGVRNIVADSSGVVWFCTVHGLVRIEGNTFARFDVENSGLACNDVRSVYQDSNDIIWIATAKGLNRVHDGMWEVFDSANSQFPASCVNFVTGDQTGTIWACGGSEKTNFLLKIDTSIKGTIYPSFPVISMTVDPRTNRLWLATHDHGLVLFDGKNAKIFIDGKTMAVNKTVTGIVIDSNGDKWLSTHHGLVYTNAG